MTHKELSTFPETTTRIIEMAVVEFSCENCDNKLVENRVKSWAYGPPAIWAYRNLAGSHKLLCVECLEKRRQEEASPKHKKLSMFLDDILYEFREVDYDGEENYSIPSTLGEMEELRDHIYEYVDNYRKEN